MSPGGSSLWSVAKNLPANARNMGSIPGMGNVHMPWDNEADLPQLLGLCPRAQALQEEKPLDEKPECCNQRVAPTRHSWRKLMCSSEDPEQPKKKSPGFPTSTLYFQAHVKSAL